MNRGPVFVSAEAARQVFTWNDAIAELREAYRSPTSPAATPPRSIATDAPAWMRVLPSMPAGRRYFGAKLMGSPGTSTPPVVEYVVVLFDRDTGHIAAFLDGNVITGLRTAATSAMALDALAPERPVRLGVLGSGFEAAMHARAFAAVRHVEEIRVYSPTPAKRERFAAAIASELGVATCATTTPHDAVDGSDVVLAAARSHGERPILYGEWLTAGATVVSIGSTVPSQREVDVSVVGWADLIVCDVLDEVLESGDLLAAREASVQAAMATLAEVLKPGGGEAFARPTNVMFKSVGSGLQDIVVAELILTRALAAGVVTPLPIAFETKD